MVPDNQVAQNQDNLVVPVHQAPGSSGSRSSTSSKRAITSFTKQTLQPATILLNSKENVLSLNAFSSKRGITLRRLNVSLSSLTGNDTEIENTFNQIQLISEGNVIATKNISSSDDYSTVLNSSIISFSNLSLNIERDFQKTIEIHISTKETLTDLFIKDWNIVIDQDDIYALDDSNNAYYNTNPITSSFSVRRTLATTTRKSTVKNFRATQVSLDSLTFEWDAYEDATGYEIDYCTGISCTDYSNKSIATTLTKTVSSLTNGTVYKFRIRATKADDRYSGYKTITQATSLIAPTLEVDTQQETTTSIDLEWNVILNADGYMIEYCIQTVKDTSCTDFANPTTINNNTTRTKTITDLQSSSQYQFRIKSIGRYPKLGSEYSSSVLGITDFLPPTNLRATDSTNTTIDLAWSSVPMGGGYEINYCDGSGCTPTTSEIISDSTITTKQLTSLTSNTAYTINISTIQSIVGNSNASQSIHKRTTLNSPDNLISSSATPTSITVSWDEVSGADGYILQSCEGENCTDYTNIYTGALLTYTNTGLTVNETYQYRAKATGTSPKINSTWSAELVATGTLAIPSRLRATSQTDTTIDLAWDSVTSAAGYTINYCDGASCTPDETEAVTTTTHTFTGLTSNTTYVFQIKSTHTDSSLNSAYSTTISQNTTLVVPENLRATSQTDTTIDLEWDAVTGADGYVVNYCNGVSCTPSGDAFTSYSASVTSATLSSLTPNTTYVFQIKATHTDSSLNSVYSTTISQSTNLSVPLNLTATSQTDTTITLAWDEVANASGYTLNYCDGASCTPDETETVSSGSTITKTLTGLTSNTIYVFQIKATHTTASLNSAYSTTISQSTTLTAPSNLRIFSQSAVAINLEWDAVTDSSGYVINYCDGVGCTPDGTNTKSSDAGTTITAMEGLTSNTTYVFQIKATHTTASLNSAYSSTISQSTVLATPENLRATSQTDTTIDLAWDEVAGSSGYGISYYCNGTGCPSTQVEDVSGGSTTTRTITGLIPNNVYTINVEARHTNSSLNSSSYNDISQSTALSSPENLSVSSPTGTTVDLEWDEVTGSSGYVINYCDGVGCTPDETEIVSGGSTTTTTLTGLTVNTTYVLQIKATHTDSSLNSAYSSTISQSTTLAAPANLRATSQTTTTISLAWDSVTNASGYVINYCDGASCSPDTTNTISGGSGISETLTGLTSNTIYVFQIKSTHTTASLDSPYSSIISQSTALSVPQRLIALSQTSTTISLAWDQVTGSSGYEINYCDGVGCTPDETETTTSKAPTLTGLTANTIYVFQVKATHTDASLNSLYSNTLSHSTALTAPANLRVAGSTSTTIDLAWDSVPAGDGYKIYSCIVGDCFNTATTLLTITDPTTAFKQITSLTPNTAYSFDIETLSNTLGDSGPSTSAQGRTKLNAPFNFALVTTTATSVTVGWGDTSGADGYALHYCEGATCGGNDYALLSTGPFVRVSDSKEYSSQLTYTHTNITVTANKVYKYRLKATGIAPEIDSVWSSELIATGTLETPASLRSTSQTSTTLTLAWGQSSGASGYAIDYCDGVGCTPDTEEIISSGSTTTATLTGLTVNTTYVLRIRATHTDSSLNSEYSDTISQNTTLASPRSVEVSLQRDTTLAVEWQTVTDADGYIIRLCSGANCIPNKGVSVTGGDTDSYTLTGLTQATEYSFQVRATGVAPESASPYSPLVHTNTILPSPANLRLKPVNTADTPQGLLDRQNNPPRTPTILTVIWDEVTGASGYTIQYCVGISCTFDSDEAVSGGSTTLHKLTGLTANTTYRIRINSVHINFIFNSRYTSKISEKTSLPSPDNLVVTAQTDTSVTLQWDSVTDAASYQVQYCNLFTQSCAEASASTSSNSTITKTVTGLNPNQPYTVIVVAKGSADEYDSDESSSLTTRTKLSRPTNFVVASKTSTSMTLEWTAAVGVSAFGRIYNTIL